MGGRPTDYTPQIAERICIWIAGGMSLRSFCRQDNTPDLSTVTRWIVAHDPFRIQYVQAREAAGYAHADDIADLAEKVIAGDIEPNAARVAMDARKWTAERMAPRAHMPQSLVNHKSPDGSMTPASVSPDLVNALASKLTE
jgi:hypothetical protein